MFNSKTFHSCGYNMWLNNPNLNLNLNLNRKTWPLRMIWWLFSQSESVSESDSESVSESESFASSLDMVVVIGDLGRRHCK